jgi:cell wall-associated NlpC family hydrolase
MSSVRAIEIRGRSRKRLRRYAGARGCARLAAALLVAVVALALLGPSGAAAAPTDQGSPNSPGPADSSDRSPLDTLIAALGAPRAERAVDAIGHGLALIEARKQVAATERRLAQEDAAAAAEPEPTPVSEEVMDPSEMLPASAGTNGTTVPHSGDGPGGKLFAHTRATVDGSTAILLSGIALAPPDAPAAVQQVINAANTIVGRPYVWGGGHASFYSYGYDCSGSVSFALFGGGLIPEPLTSGSLEGWGEPGPGKWITVYANADHTFMEIAGLRWDTVGDARGTGPRWHLAPNDTSGFVVRHPPGL